MIDASAGFLTLMGNIQCRLADDFMCNLIGKLLRDHV